MDSRDEARDYDAMDHGAVNRVFVADFLAIWDGDNPILDVGTGTAQIPIELCRQTAAARVLAIDRAHQMLHVAQENIRGAALESRVQLEVSDAKSMPFAHQRFGAVISNSIVHHIPDPQRVLVEMIRVLRPGGTLLVRDLVRPADETTLLQLLNQYAKDANPHQRQMFQESLQAALTLTEIRDLVAGQGCDASSVQQTSDRHWTWRIFPKNASWRCCQADA
jgi:ubiquinone/menaquinone biosynthesis C-methylase UbiE